MMQPSAANLKYRSVSQIVSATLLCVCAATAQTPPKKVVPPPAPPKAAPAPPKAATPPATATHTPAPGGTSTAGQHGTTPQGPSTQGPSTHGGGVTTSSPTTTNTHGGGITTSSPGATTTHGGGITTSSPTTTNTHGGGVTTNSVTTSSTHPSAGTTNTGITTNNHVTTPTPNTTAPGAPGGAAGNVTTTNQRGGGAGAQQAGGNNHPNGTGTPGRPQPGTGGTGGVGGRPLGGPGPDRQGVVRPPTAPRPEAIKNYGALGGHPAPRDAREVHAEHGLVRTRADGRPMDLHDSRHGEDIHHNLYGERRVAMDRPGGGRAYYERGRPGYLGHPFQAHGYDYNRRTYYDHGRAYERFYRPYPYHGYALDVYVPGRYYAPGFYGWAYQPWGPRVSYAWGFGANPWYGVYGGYFQPYQVYPTPALWLTDYMISQSLAAGYAAQMEAGAPPAPYSGPALSPDVKQMISQEVQSDIALENAEADANRQQRAPDPEASGIGRLLRDGHSHVFVAGKEVDVVQASGPECALTDGDVIQVSTPPAEADTTATATVLASKGGRNCPVQAQVAIGLDELSEMNNHLRETIDRGLEELQKKQGTGGLPKAPDSANAKGTSSVVAENDPPPEPAGAKELENLAAQSLQDEGELIKETQVGAAGGGPNADSGGAPPEISLGPGQTLDQVQAGLGAPTKKVAIGNRTIYWFGDTKVTFVGGKVTQIE